MKHRIVLGSSSPFRAEIMREMGLSFEIIRPDVDEKSIRHPNPSFLVSKLAMVKARAILPHLGTDTILITADQVTVCDGEIREKPADADEARRFLRSYRTHPLVCVNGVYVYNTATHRDLSAVTTATVWFRNLTDAGIEDAIARTPVLQCAGACAAGRPEFDPYVWRIQGGKDDLFGLPKAITLQLIEDSCAP